MKINAVSITYGELRSTGFPSFSNTRHELTLGATLDPGETARTVQNQLMDIAKREVRRAFGDNVDQKELPLDIAF